MNICIDFTRLIPKTGNPYHGGGYYTYRVIEGLLSRLKKDDLLSVIWPCGYTPRIEADERLFSNTSVKHIYSNNMWEEDFTEINTLFLPLIDPWNFNKLDKIKKHYPQLRTVVTLHDLRILDILKFDAYNKFYYQHGMGEYLLHYLKRHFTFYKCRKGLKTVHQCTDLLMTDSNYSMQQILRFTGAININYFYIPIDRDSSVIPEDGNFILFVSANREEKNFMRSLEAYLEAVEANLTSLPLYVTGTSANFTQVISRNKKINRDLLDKYVKLLGYVSEQEIQKLYATCSYLLYTSKSEGFGLPVLNAGIYGRPVLASNRTSVPEVLGSIPLYVDPYDKKSIIEGIKLMGEKSEREKYENRANKHVPLLETLMLDGVSRIVDELMQE